MSLYHFVIIYTGRCGSSLLEAILDNHTALRCEGELMHSGALGRESGSIYNPCGIWSCISNSKDKQVASGFKLSAQHFVDLQVDIETWLDSSKPDKLIFLRRDNILEQFLSVKLAVANNAWTSESGIYHIDKIYISPEEFLDFKSNIDISNQRLLAISNQFHGLNITYEDIINIPITTINTIFEYLNVSLLVDIDLENLRFKKQRLKSMRDSIINFDEIMDIFPSYI